MRETVDTFKCFGPSQWPLVRTGDEVRIVPLERTPIRPGDLVVFNHRGARICHRLLSSRRENGVTYWLTKGDANLRADGWIPEPEIGGRVIAINGRPVTAWRFRVASKFFFYHSKSQYRLFELIFHSPLGRKLGLLRMKLLPRPIFMAAYGRFTAPWGMIAELLPSRRYQALRRRWDRIVDKFVTPPVREGVRMKRHRLDYGHAHLYEEIFARYDSAESGVTPLCGSTANRILDVGGGKGRVAFHLARRGYHVTLVDNAESMLAGARAKMESLEPTVRERVTLVNQDIRRMYLGQRFDRIFSVNNALEHVGNEEQVIEALNRLQLHLAPDGEAFFDVHCGPFWQNTPEWKTGRWQRQESGILISGQRYNVWGRTFPGCRDTEVVWEHAVSSNPLQFDLLRSRIDIYAVDSWRAMFAASGWRLVQTWAGWNGLPQSDALPKIVFRAVAA